MTIAITGSTGRVGAHVADHLTDLAPRLIVRDASRAPAGFAHVAVADYSDPAASRAALDGVTTLFMVSAGESFNRRDHHRAFIEAAATAGVEHVVYTSFLGADAEATFTLGRDHADAEAALRESGMTFTFLRDNFYSDLLPYFSDESGAIRGPAGEGVVSAVARADVSDAAAAVLRAPAEHINKVYELTGPEALSLAQIASRASVALGRELSFVNETIAEAYGSRRNLTDEQWQLDAWVSTYTAIADGSVARVTTDVETLTGHPARSIEDALAA